MMARYQEETEQRGWFSRLHLSWPMLFLIGWLLYELTTKPTLGAVAVCLKFGWEDFRAALWLRRRDPWGLRGRACFWLYQASGLWKVAIVAFLMSLAFVVISPIGQGAAQAPRLAAIMDVLAWTGMATLIGLVFSLFALAYALILAWRGGLKLWASSDVHVARRHGVWPPLNGVPKRGNGAAAMVVGSMFLLGLVLILLGILIGGFFLFSVLQLNWGGAEEVLIPILGIGNMVGGAALMLYCLERIQPLIAQEPNECWGEHLLQPPETQSITYPSTDSLK